MIKITTKGHYGIRLMVNLALHYRSSGDAVILKQVAEEESLSLRYLEQIIIPLRIAGLVKSIRGAGGGYSLSRKPGEINVRDVLYAVEGNLNLVECNEDDTFCDRTSTCATYEVWKGATSRLRDYFGRLTLQDALEIGERKAAALKQKNKTG